MGQPITTNDAKTALSDLRQRIDQTCPKSQDIPDSIQQKNPSQDGYKIRYFERITKAIKGKFQTNGKLPDQPLSFTAPGAPTGQDSVKIGKTWHTSFKKYINNPNGSGNEIAKPVVDAVKEWLKDGHDGLELLQSEFPLHGYMKWYKGVSKSWFWNGKADAIGLYKGKYVIVEWKAVNLLEFWEKNRLAYGDHLHQCLVYAKLLQLHLNLPQLPYILIVPIHSITGKDVRPCLFRDFPQECKNEINMHIWSKEENATPKILSLPKAMFKHDIKQDKTMDEILNDDYPIKQFLRDTSNLGNWERKLDIFGPGFLDSTLEKVFNDSEYDELKVLDIKGTCVFSLP